jgi:hypothetical protein
MPDHRGSRFALEVLFLLALAVGLTLADLQPLEIGGVMLLGWLIVAALEWAAWRDEPHYGSGLPPRYYVPTVNLPPARPLEQVPAGYPEAQRDEAPTWIASAALRAEMLGEWPHSAPVENEEAAAAEEVPPTEPPVSLPPPLLDVEQMPAPAAAPPPEPEPEPLPAAGAPADDRGVVPAEAAGEPDEVTDDALQPAHPDGADLAPALHDVVLERSRQATARYSLDPLAEQPVKRRFGRGGTPEPPPAVEVPARPAGVRALPGRPTRQD